MGIDGTAVKALMQRARREVDDGLLPAVQVALAYEGEVVAFETFGDATDDTRFVVYSATKAFVAGAVWALIGDGAIDVTLPVVHYVPEFATNGKHVITVEQVMLHTSGFPRALMRPLQGLTSASRCEAFAGWQLDWQPGAAYQYHPTSAHWVLAEIIERVTGIDFRDVVEQRVTSPAGLPRVLGAVPFEVANLVAVGQHATTDEIVAAFGRAELDMGEVTTEMLLRFNRPDVRAEGVPGAGGQMRATDLAMYYQAVLHNPGEMWRPEVLADVTGHVRNNMVELATGVPGNRTLGLIQAGDDGLTNMRGMGRTVSPRTIGHNGARGQIAWGDPVSGLSFGYCTNGLDEHEVREPRRTTALASLAGVCAT